MVRAELSTRKPGNIRLNPADSKIWIGHQHDSTSRSTVSDRMEVSSFDRIHKPADKLLVPQNTLALILFHVLLVRVPGTDKKDK